MSFTRALRQAQGPCRLKKNIEIFMKFKFKIQQYQTDAVENTIKVFTGQPYVNGLTYRRDLGKVNVSNFGNPIQTKLVFDTESTKTTADNEDTGYANHRVELKKEQLLANINAIQDTCSITRSKALSSGVAPINLDIEMETGTGKTYVYIKTMFELNKQYGWSKFIIVVPSIAIREGVAKSFNMLEEHFMQHYGKKARWFVYNSSNLNMLDKFSQDADLSVMIINMQAFASSMKEDGRSKESRIIYSVRDEFRSRKPIDVIAANNPIIIMDEPQRMTGDATKKGIKQFKPLFILNYSATHKEHHDTIYALDALDAYKQKLVKRIRVKGFEVKNLRGTTAYLYLDSIVLSHNKPPMARIEFEKKLVSGDIKRTLKTFAFGDNLQVDSGLPVYKDYVITDINPAGYVTFLNGTTLKVRDVVGDVKERDMQRVQIRETIKSHFEKERQLFKRGIKCLSLFFIDEVANYKSYDNEGNEVKGDFWQIFEKEYENLLHDQIKLFDDDYTAYLHKYKAEDVHRGYFSIDKKSGRIINSAVERKSDISDDISAYELILKNKERLLSFEEPTRFIFSHSALREGWDNPNVFQICTLRHSNSNTAKRQEVGRGLRICVDKFGTRMDADLLGDDVHEVNELTVVANESYASFTTDLQKDIREALRERAVYATIDYFKGKTIKVGEELHVISEKEASRIIIYLEDNGYVDDNNCITPDYHNAVASGTLAPLPQQLSNISEGVFTLINGIFDPSALKDMIQEVKTSIPTNKINENFHRAEFQALWNEINHQYVYTVSYDSDELIEKVILHINAELEVITNLRYVMTEGLQSQDEVTEFGNTRTQSQVLSDVSTSMVKYDLVGDIAKGAHLTRRSVVKILKGMDEKKLYYFKNNPEEFIRKVITIIKEEKSTMIVEHIHYNITEGKYSSDIFTVTDKVPFDRAYDSKKHVTDYVLFDSKTEQKFAEDMDAADEVVVYAKLPRSKFYIPTPVGNYAPDWAIAIKRNDVKHIFFIAETKGSMSSMDLSAIEKAKIDCAKKLFNSISSENVKYHEVDSFETLRNLLAAEC